MELEFFSDDLDYCQLCGTETFPGSGQRGLERRRRAQAAALGAAPTLPGPSNSNGTFGVIGNPLRPTAMSFGSEISPEDIEALIIGTDGDESPRP